MRRLPSGHCARINCGLRIVPPPLRKRVIWRAAGRYRDRCTGRPELPGAVESEVRVRRGMLFINCLNGEFECCKMYIRLDHKTRLCDEEENERRYLGHIGGECVEQDQGKPSSSLDQKEDHQCDGGELKGLSWKQKNGRKLKNFHRKPE